MDSNTEDEGSVMAEERQGLKTTEKPFGCTLGLYEHVITFRKEVFTQVSGVRPDEVEAVVGHLNKAFQLGFSDASEKLLNKD